MSSATPAQRQATQPTAQGRARVEMEAAPANGTTFPLPRSCAHFTEGDNPLLKPSSPGLKATWAFGASRFGAKERPPANGYWFVWHVTAACWRPDQPDRSGYRAHVLLLHLLIDSQNRSLLPVTLPSASWQILPPHSCKQRQPSPTVPILSANSALRFRANPFARPTCVRRARRQDCLRHK